MTEPYAGSDLADMETTGVRDGDYFVVNGIKRFQTNAAAADLYMAYVKSSEDPAVAGKLQPSHRHDHREGDARLPRRARQRLGRLGRHVQLLPALRRRARAGAATSSAPRARAGG